MTKLHTDESFCKLGLAVIEIEASALDRLKDRIDHHFAKACRLLLSCEGRIVVLGMGKSGHIGNKIAATLASTGSPAFFVHPGEASHGDLGMITQKDIVLAISNSGETEEILIILPLLKRLCIPLVSMTGNSNSTLAKAANVHLDVSVAQEACPLNLAPTASTTATLAMGDALAIALLEARGFTAEDFARAHPSGSLGRRLLLRVEDVMRTGDAIPRVSKGTKLSAALVEMTQKRMGITTVVDDVTGYLIGAFSDGDLRRALDNNIDIHQINIEQVMTPSCRTISADLLAAEALGIMETYKITSLFIADENNKPIGALHMHDLLTAGVA
jgi:arabinose-5-phosphate isomerase